MRELERQVLLSVLDRQWREHLYEMDYLQEGIRLRGYGQRDPLVEYQREAFDMFTAMMDGIKEESVGFLFYAEVNVEPAGRGRRRRHPGRRGRGRREHRRSESAACRRPQAGGPAPRSARAPPASPPSRRRRRSGARRSPTCSAKAFAATEPAGQPAVLRADRRRPTDGVDAPRRRPRGLRARRLSRTSRATRRALRLGPQVQALPRRTARRPGLINPSPSSAKCAFSRPVNAYFARLGGGFRRCRCCGTGRCRPSRR